MELPFISREDYPPARRVNFECCAPTNEIENLAEITTSTGYLAAMKVADHFFAAQLFEDDVLFGTYKKMRRSPASKKFVSKDPFLKSQILTIERALKNRMEFAKQQKIHVLENLIFIQCDAEKKRMNKEADDEIKTVLSILKNWNSHTLTDDVEDFVATVSNLMMY